MSIETVTAFVNPGELRAVKYPRVPGHYKPSLRLKGDDKLIPVVYRGPPNPPPYRDLSVVWEVAEPWHEYRKLKVGKYFDIVDQDEFVGHGQVVAKLDGPPSDE